jgi:hypothetical protein
MFKKITAKRDPQATIGSELKREFGAHFSRLQDRGRQLCAKYPRPLFILMLVCMTGSGILAFTVMRNPKPPTLTLKANDNGGPLTGIGQLMRTADALQQVFAIQSQVRGLLKKDKLTAADSLVLRRALQKIDSIQRAGQGQLPINHQQKSNKP